MKITLVPAFLLGAVCMNSWLWPVSAMAADGVSIPPQVDPGAVLNDALRDMQRRQQIPWIDRPVQPSDTTPAVPEDALIRWERKDVDATIRPRPSDCGSPPATP